MRSVRAYQGAYGAILDGYALGDAQLARDKIFLAESNGEILGFYSLIVDGEPELDLMFVSDAAQGTGLGKVLFDHMRETARQAGVAFVTIVSHPPSVGFYERMGAIRPWAARHGNARFCGSPSPELRERRGMLKAPS
jgi:GNAT superfamily N-acetyltransferase